MKRTLFRMIFLLIAVPFVGVLPARAGIFVQCPGDKDGDGRSDTPGIACIHLTSGDGFVQMADFVGGKRRIQYIFGFSDVTHVLSPNDLLDPATVTKKIMEAGALAANFPAPLITVNEGDQLFLGLSNVSFIKRPDLFDPHTVHWHGFPQAAAIFDGLPESAIAINIGSTATYYYKVNDPGTYMYHCHAEATEHMQMGMLGNLYVRPKQNGSSVTYGGKTYTKFAYNDGDGSTGYDVEIAIQLSGFDPDFHDSSMTVQPLPFSQMLDKYPLMNGRGYPDTVAKTTGFQNSRGETCLAPPAENRNKLSQCAHSLIEAAAGQRILLRISNLNVTRPYTLTSPGIPMQVVGKDARIQRGPSGRSLYYKTSSIHLGSGETADVILDTAGIPRGTYFLYAAELNYLSNHLEDFGGMMTEIRIN